MSHTKGEWEHGEFNYPADGKIGRCEIREGMGILAHVYLPAKKETGYKEGRANARLIAAAPDLLEACEPFARIADMIPEPDAPDPQWQKFNTAIRALPLDRYREAKVAIAKAKQ